LVSEMCQTDFSAGAYTVSDKPLRLKTLSGHARLMRIFVTMAILNGP